MLSAGFLSGGANSSTVTLDGIFKHRYDSGSQILKRQQNLNADYFKDIKVSPLKLTPQGLFLSALMTGNESGGAINENQTFNSPQSANPQQPFIQPRQIVWPFQITGRAIELSKGNEEAFMNAIETQQMDNLERMYSDMNRQSQGNGAGVLSFVPAAVVASSTVPVSNIFFFRRGQIVDIWNSAGTLKLYTVAVGAVNYTTFSWTALNVSSSAPELLTLSGGELIYKQNIHDNAPSGGKEMIGTQAIVDTTVYSTTFEGLPVASNPEWVGNVIDAGNNPISQDFLAELYNAVYLVGGVSPTKIVSQRGQYRVFKDSELQKTRYEPGKIEAGATVVKWEDLEWVTSKDAPLNEVAMLSADQIERFESRDVHLADYDGKILTKVQNQSAYFGYYEWIGNIGTRKRNAHGRGINLVEPSYFS